ncbi:Hsp90 domain containing protein [Nitzschia inconspicua]|uniref:Hsp90 domain containing protein n=1 Tax=Nitzschia inconspicua TaxID=303405 RepID=A0A9K3LCH2_9STRA|nr:Hsp90 domain containing protein [Nitzschia inconspicua]
MSTASRLYRLTRNRNSLAWRKGRTICGSIIKNNSLCGVQQPFSSVATTTSYSFRQSVKTLPNSHAAFSTSATTEDEEDAPQKNNTKSSEGPTLSLKNQKTLEFQAETKQLLDIVTNSLYTDKEVFLRELVSNASDALEKLRHLQSAGSKDLVVIDSDRPLQITITLDEVESSLTIADTGVGMTADELVENLGTIARSGSKNFIAQLEAENSANHHDAGLNIARGIIGKFGVGFYSCFMVADKVQVTTRPARGGPITVWTSDGTGTYELAELADDDETRQDRGTTIKLFLKEEYWSLLSEAKIQEILTKYSNFVQFPILLNGNRVNTVQAVWSMDPKEVERDTYVDFYKYVAQAIDDPLEILHFRADAPLEVQALLFIPSFHSEKYGMERMDPGVSLYSRKVLIESKSPDILPDWLRFVKGVVDSEDLPLAISREKPQDSALIAKLKRVLTRRFLSQLEKMAKKESDKYLKEFYPEYNHFLKEGVCQDFEFQPTLAKLLRFETNKNTSRNLVSLDEYISNLRPEQDQIYYLTAPTREAAAMSPYLEAFERANLEVIFVYTAIDDFVMANLSTYEGRPLVSVEKSDIDLSKFDTTEKEDEDKDETDDANDGSSHDGSSKLSATEAMEVCMWFKDTLGENKVGSCRPSSRLVSSPAIVTDNESGLMRRMMRMVDTSDGTRDSMPLPKQNVEINPSHPIIVGLYNIKDKEPVLARVLAEQVYDNCLVAAGLLDDSRTMLPRLNDLMVSLVKGAEKYDKSTGTSNSDEEQAAESSKT